MKWLRRVAISLVSILFLAMLAAYVLLRGSLPQLDGTIAADVSLPVSIERDAQGVATITASNRNDLAYATGYAHGQDRFFQMDLQRRLAAGELAELLGSSLVDVDKRFRRHGFRTVARQVIKQASSEQRKLIDAYVAGVNAGLRSLRVRPFEYLVLQVPPREWSAEDCVLVAFAMYIDLNDSDGAHELERARLHAALPQAVFDLLYPSGTEWDATIDQIDLTNASTPLPSADVFDTRKQPVSRSAANNGDDDFPGSNNWALAGSRTQTGSALIANDMHLSLRIPHIWYHARLIVKSDNANLSRDLAGVTLPGLPLLVAGSNGHIAWGFTNTHGNYDDLVIVESDAQHPNQYRNRDTYLNYNVRREQINVRGGAPITVDYRDTIWGPLIDEELDGKSLALAWTAQRPDGTNLRQFELESARTVSEALDIANTAGIPVQNFVVGDTEGHIAWTPIGKLPKRSGFDGRLPACWGCAPNIGWDGWLAPKEYPRVIDPPGGQLWSANSRVLGGAGVQAIGDEDQDRGARAKQIRDDLRSLSNATPRDMLKVQLDDRAVFLSRWRDVLLSVLNQENLNGHPARGAAYDPVAKWSGHAAIDDAGYRIVRAFRVAVQDEIFDSIVAAAQARYPKAKFKPSARFEDTLWRIMTTQPDNFLPPQYKNWNEAILAALDRALAQLAPECDVDPQKIAHCTWGKRNTLSMQHPLAPSLPLVGHWLHMPMEELPGDNDMPRVQGVSFGASERFAVSPGRESEGIFHMPGGQSGHPLSQFFSAGHEAWVHGEPTPYLPGDSAHKLDLAPLH